MFILISNLWVTPLDENMVLLTAKCTSIRSLLTGNIVGHVNPFYICLGTRFRNPCANWLPSYNTHYSLYAQYERDDPRETQWASIVMLPSPAEA